MVALGVSASDTYLSGEEGCQLLALTRNFSLDPSLTADFIFN